MILFHDLNEKFTDNTPHTPHLPVHPENEMTPHGKKISVGKNSPRILPIAQLVMGGNGKRPVQFP